MPDMNARTRLDGLSAAGICPGCGSVIGTVFHRCDLVRRDVYEQVVADRDHLHAENERLGEQLRDRSAYLDWLVDKVCPNHNAECHVVGCPAIPPEWEPSP